jgi:hypothetical protein
VTDDRRDRRARVRMKDIALDLGISVVAVSKALHHHSDIGEETVNVYVCCTHFSGRWPRVSPSSSG